MQTDFLHVSMRMCVCVCVTACVCVCAVRYTRDRVQSRAIEREKTEGGELMRRQRRRRPIPIDNLTSDSGSVYCTYAGSILEIPFEKWRFRIRVKKSATRQSFTELSLSRGVGLIIMRLLALKKKRKKMFKNANYSTATAVEQLSCSWKHTVCCMPKLLVKATLISYIRVCLCQHL